MPQSRNLDLFALECFDALLHERSVSRVAQRMNTSQSSISDALARLRKRFADALLVRSREGMSPTERAEALWPKVRASIENLEAILDRVADFCPRKRANVFI